MLWIKRNLFIVVGGILSLAMLGGAGYFVYNAFYDNDDQDVALDALKVELQGLQSGIYPSDENITLVQSNTALARLFMNEAGRLLVSESVKPMNPAAFNVELIKALDRLRRDGTNASVELPPKYEFTFGEVKTRNWPGYTVEPFLAQLQDITAICGVLYKAKVKGLDSINRVPAFPGDPGGADLIMDLAAKTNAFSTNANLVITPYRITFRGFVGELAAVLNGFAQTKEFIAVRQIDLEAGGAGGPLVPAAMDPMSDSMMRPGGPGGLPGVPGAPGIPGAPMSLAPGMAAPAPAVAAPAPVQPVRPAAAPRPGALGAVPPPPKSSLTPILDEKPLRVTMVLDVIKTVRRPVAAPVPGAPAPTPAQPVTQ